jgi:hypothetical protein
LLLRVTGGQTTQRLRAFGPDAGSLARGDYASAATRGRRGSPAPRPSGLRRCQPGFGSGAPMAREKTPSSRSAIDRAHGMPSSSFRWRRGRRSFRRRPDDARARRSWLALATWSIGLPTGAARGEGPRDVGALVGAPREVRAVDEAFCKAKGNECCSGRSGCCRRVELVRDGPRSATRRHAGAVRSDRRRQCQTDALLPGCWAQESM